MVFLTTILLGGMMPWFIKTFLGSSNHDHKDSIKVALMLEEEGIDLLEVSGGNYENPAMIVGTNYFDDIKNKLVYIYIIL